MNPGQSPKILNLSGSLSIDRASPLRDELIAAIGESDSVILDLSEVEEIDLACLQVIYAAKAFARAEDKRLHFVGSIPARIAQRLVSCGFLRGAGERAENFESSLVGF
jgi:anti-anti-sigma regulatory factor